VFAPNAVSSTHIFDVIDKRDISQKDAIPLFDYLSGVFGTTRIERALTDMGYDISVIKENKRLLGKEDFQSLFPRLLLVVQDDYLALLDEIKGIKPLRNGIRNRESELQTTFQNVQHLEDCTPEQLKILEKILIPFENEMDPFLGKTPLKTATPELIISNEALVRHVAYCVEHLRRAKASKEDWEFYLGKRLAQPALPDHIVISHPQGLLQLDKIIQGEGAYKMFFQPVGENKELDTYIVYRGTRGGVASDEIHDTLATLREDISEELGGMGALATYEETKEALEELARKKRNVTLLGYSLGGVHAQRDAILNPSLFHRLVTVASPGIDKESCHLFAKSYKSGEDSKEIIHNIDCGDIVTYSGDALVGASIDNSVIPASLKVRYYMTSVRLAESSENIKAQLYSIKQLFEKGPFSFFPALKKTVTAHLWSPSLHAHEKTHDLIEFNSSIETEKEFIRTLVNRDPTLFDSEYERLRKLGSRMFPKAGFYSFIEKIYINLNESENATTTEH